MKYSFVQGGEVLVTNSRQCTLAKTRRAANFLLCTTLLAPASTFTAQEIHLGLPEQAGEARAQRVRVDADTQSIMAGRPDWIELRFHVTPGFHINSHTPHDELLIPTSLETPSSRSYHVQKAMYPPGEPLRLTIGEGETLSTYTGDFRIRVEVVAAKGESSFVGSLHYQACNAASCFPPRDLPVNVTLVAR